jgi:hypothetical protein
VAHRACQTGRRAGKRLSCANRAVQAHLSARPVHERASGAWRTGCLACERRHSPRGAWSAQGVSGLILVRACSAWAACDSAVERGYGADRAQRACSLSGALLSCARRARHAAGLRVLVLVRAGLALGAQSHACTVGEGAGAAWGARRLAQVRVGLAERARITRRLLGQGLSGAGRALWAYKLASGVLEEARGAGHARALAGGRVGCARSASHAHGLPGQGLS